VKGDLPMTKVVFLLLLIGHVIGDFYILPKRMTEKRQETFGKLLLHSALYLLILTIVTIPVLRLPILLWVLIISAVHFLTDLIVYFIKKKKPDEKTDAVLYSVDQFVHILVILIASFSLSYVYINYIPFIQNGLKRIQIDFSDILSWTLAALIILQPASVTIRKLLYRYRPVSNDVQKGYPKEAFT
jgi:magnesium-transporting ATPase (P-type)